MNAVLSRPMVRWLAALLLMLPAAVPYWAHYSGGDAPLPTGFIQADQPNVMAASREYFDGGFRLLYSNPFVPEYDGPEIYFQPQTFFLGVLSFISRIDPGLIFVLFGFVAALAAVRVAIALYEERVPLATPAAWVGLALFVWGGGLLVLGGAVSSPAHAFVHDEGLLFGSLMRWDPFDGWWFLNFGRNLIMPLEAFYHALFFGAVLALLRGAYRTGALLTAVLCLSHPYSGSELLAVVAVWGTAEALVFSRGARERQFIFWCIVIGVLHVAYYLLYLPQFPEHRSLVSQWSKAWFLDWRSALLGYGLVAPVAVVAAFRRGFFSRRDDRLLLLWALIAFLLAKHELFTDHPVEPLHFTRGYIWTPLFLLGAPVLVRFLETLQRRTLLSRGVFLLIVVVSLMDNAVWFTAVARGYLIEHVRLEEEQRRVFQVLHDPACAGRVVLTPDAEIAALTPVYTPLRVGTTLRKFTDEDIVRRDRTREFFFEGKVPEEWRDLRTAIVFDRRPPGRGDSLAALALTGLGGIQRELYADARYRVVLVDGGGK